MKRNVLLILLWILLAGIGSLEAQRARSPYEPGTLYLGLKAGGHLKIIANQNNYGQFEMAYKPAIGLAGGIYLQYNLNSWSSLLIEGVYQQQGQKYSDSFKGKQYDKTISLDYLAFPVLYRYLLSGKSGAYDKALKFNQPKWFIEGGIQPAILVSADASWTIDGQATDFLSFITDGGNPNLEQIEANGQPASAEELFKDFDVVLVVGAGFQQDLQNNIRWYVELRGGIGLLDINADKWRLPNKEGIYGASRNSFLGIQVGLSFSLY